jgi:hypothetical protein
VQAAHITPPAPHDVLDSPASGSHTLPAAQQPVHELPPQLQTPLAQPSPLAHAPQRAPPVPHDAFDCDDGTTQVVPSQQPVGHEVASQTHVPLFVLHSWPWRHASQRLPAVPHSTLDCDAGCTQTPWLVQQPSGQLSTVHDVCASAAASAGEEESAAPSSVASTPPSRTAASPPSGGEPVRSGPLSAPPAPPSSSPPSQSPAAHTLGTWPPDAHAATDAATSAIAKMAATKRMGAQATVTGSETR